MRLKSRIVSNRLIDRSMDYWNFPSPKPTLVEWASCVDTDNLSKSNSPSNLDTSHPQIPLAKEYWWVSRSYLTARRIALVLSVTAAWIVKKSQWRRESVSPARKMCEEKIESAFTSPFILPEIVIRTKREKSSSLVENMRSGPQRSK